MGRATFPQLRTKIEFKIKLKVKIKFKVKIKPKIEMERLRQTTVNAIKAGATLVVNMGEMGADCNFQGALCKTTGTYGGEVVSQACACARVRERVQECERGHERAR